ncbi:MAG: CfrBI family restriction endonuclease [Flavobacteriaceae bacterium]|nr:CfrBI family restriction endonuclease [Flavobacteriaceae bacterium]
MPKENYKSGNRKGVREVDFSLIDDKGNTKKCEVKLQGQGNPEGADSTFARDSNIFIAGTLSDTNIQQLNKSGIHWVELMRRHGFLRFGKILKELNIPHRPLNLKSGKDIDNFIEQTVFRS